MSVASGIHHLAITTADVQARLSSFCDVLGAELEGPHWVHGVPGPQHGFVRLGDSSHVAVVTMPVRHDLTEEGR